MDKKETGRVEAFSDGVFTVAITLLILEIKVPEIPPGAAGRELIQALLARWPSFLAFVISFVTILIMWINHHGLFNLIQTVDRRALFANGLVLLLVTSVPFPTAVLARYINEEAANVAAAFYCGTYLLICLAFNVLWLTAAAHNRLIRAHVEQAHLNRVWKAYLLALPIYLVATVLALFSAFGGLAVCSLLWLLWARLDYGPQRRPGTSRHAVRRRKGQKGGVGPGYCRRPGSGEGRGMASGRRRNELRSSGLPVPRLGVQLPGVKPAPCLPP